MTREELKRLRQTLEMTQAGLGRRLGMSRDAISKYEMRQPIPRYVELALKEIVREEKI